MGCGSSSLKGDKPDGLAGDQPQPIRKVNTNFSTVDYAADNGNKKRRMTEYAPEETIRNKSETSATEPGPASGRVSRPDTRADDEGPGGEKIELEPYKSQDTAEAAEMSYPHENAGAGAAASSSRAPGEYVNGADGPDPTSSKAKEQFAEANDPGQQNAGLAPEEGSKEKKRSWIEKLKESRKGEISDEDMKKVS